MDAVCLEKIDPILNGACEGMGARQMADRVPEEMNATALDPRVGQHFALHLGQQREVPLTGRG